MTHENTRRVPKHEEAFTIVLSIATPQPLRGRRLPTRTLRSNGTAQTGQTRRPQQHSYAAALPYPSGVSKIGRTACVVGSR